MNSFINYKNKKRVVSTLFLYIIIFSTACDFKSPEQWVTPTWYLPLTVPLIDTEYSFEGMTQDSTIIQDTLNNTIKLIFSDDIVEPGGERPGITDDIFNFEIDGTEQTDIFSQEFSIDRQPSEKIGGETISIPVPIFAFSTKEAESIADGCFSIGDLDKPVFDQFPDGVPNTFQILSTLEGTLSDVKLGETSIIQKVHLLTITGGKLGAKFTNSLPFPVKRFNVKYISYEYTDQKRTLRDIEFTDIPQGNSNQNLDMDISPDSPVQFGDSLLIELSIEIDTTNSYNNLNPNSNVCGIPIPSDDGWLITQDYQFSVDLEFEIGAESAENIICTTNPIIIDTTINTEFPSIEKIDIKGGRITEDISTVPSNEINYIELIASNSLFSTTAIELEFSNFYDIVNDNDIPVVLGGELSTTGLDTTFSDTLALKYLGVPGEPDSVMKSISIGMKIQIDGVIDGPIALGNTYALSVSKLLMSKIKLAYLTAISYDMGFDTPSSNIAGMPQGGIGLQFYDVQLILDIYTQIGIPIQLDMVLNGIKGTDSVITLIDPVLNVPIINTSGDSVRTVITLNREGQRVEWYHTDNINGDIPDSVIITPIDTDKNSIVDVMNFAPETIEFGGGANINGSGFLSPNSYLWGTFTLIAPFAFVFEQPINIIPAAPTSMSPMDQSTSQQIDSSLVEAALNITINNSSPLGGELSLLISDSTIFPLFIDSLVTGSWDSQLKPELWKTIWDTLNPRMIIDSIHFTAVDTFDKEIKALEVKFFNDDSLQFFIGRMFELGFPRTDSIEYHLGYVNPEFPEIYESNLILNKSRMDWVITDKQRYNINMITFDRSPIQSIVSDDTSFIPLTFQTSNFIGVQAYLTLTLDIGGLGRENNTTLINGDGN